MSKEQVWIITGTSESGNDYGPVASNRDPSETDLKRLVFRWDGDINNPTGPGAYGSNVHVSIQVVDIVIGSL